MSVNAVNSDGSLLRVAGGTLYADLAVGSIVPFGGSAIPSGYLLCNGAEVLKTAYAELYAVIGDAFGTASDNTKFKLPDLREAVPVGSGTRGSGVADHDTYAVGQFKDDQLQDHDHKVKRTGLNGGTVMEGIVNWSNGDPAANTSPASINTTTRTGTTTHGKQLGVNYIIKAKQVAVPADFKEAIDDALSEFAKPISLVPVNNSSIFYNKSRIIGGIVTVCASITVPSGNHLVKENAVVNVPNLGTSYIGYILPCLYRNVGSGAEEPGYAIIQTDGNIYPYYTKSEYNEIRVNASYSSKI